MALRRASLSFLKALQVQNATVGGRPAAACMQFSATAPLSESRRPGCDALDRNAYGRSFTQQLHTMDQAKNDDHETFHYEADKMKSEGGGTEEKSYQEKATEVLKTKADKMSGSDDVKGKAEDTADAVKDQASKEVDTTKDMFKDLPQKTSETASELKDVGVEAGKAVVRDAGKVAEKVGLSSETATKAKETATEFKEVGEEAGKAVVRDAKKVGEKVGL